MARQDEARQDENILARATAEANETFGKLAKVVEEATKGEGAKAGGTLDVLDVVRRAGLEIDEAGLKELQVERLIPIYPWIPWYVWFPWRPLWCWWWHRRYYWYRCCPWWWYRCHWYPWQG